MQVLGSKVSLFSGTAPYSFSATLFACVNSNR
jgi:hypothetical protein